MPAGSAEAAIVASFRGVSTALTGSVLLQEVNLELPAGVTTAIIGESGSGKSSLLNHVNGLLRPDTGTVSVFGEPVDYGRLTELRRRMGFAVQEVGLFPHLTVEANLRLPPRVAAVAEGVDERIAELMALMELDAALLPRYPHELSGGQRQRVGLCRAMMLSPALLLLDEPFSGVDPINRQRIYEEFLRLRDAEDVSVVLVTHDADEARLLASRVVVMHAGRVLQAGPIDAVTAEPVDERVASLLSGRQP